MAEAVTQLVNAVAEEINSVEWSVPFAAQANYLPQFTPQELKETRGSVSPGTYTETMASREAAELVIEIVVGLQRKMDAVDAAAIGEMVDLTSGVLRFMRGRRLAAFPAARWRASEMETIYSPEHLGGRVFTSVLKLTYVLHEVSG